MTVGGEVFHRDVEYFEPVVKKRVITNIEINVLKDRVKTMYSTADTILGHWFTEEELDRCPRTKRQAEEVAHEWAVHRKREYLG